MAFLLLAGTPLLAADRTLAGERTALDRYIAAPDPNYSFRVAPAIAGEGYTTYMKPLKGWTAFFAELTYDNGTPAPHKFTTQVRVVPDIKPFKCHQPTPPAR